MTTFYRTYDERFQVSNPATGGTFYAGRQYSKWHAGDNQVPGLPKLTPHKYDSIVSDVSSTFYTRLATIDPNYRNRVNIGSPVFALKENWGPNHEIALLGKLQEAYDMHDFSAGVFVGELGETVGMVADRVKQIARAGMAVKKGNLATAAAILKSGYTHGANRKKNPFGSKRDGYGKMEGQRLSDAWLELAFGWRPLIRDVYDMSGAIQLLGGARQVQISAQVSIPLIPSIVANSFFHAEASGLCKYSKRIIAHLDEVVPTIPEYLGLADPASIVWELVPFSFVADWFIPIGDYLKIRSFASRCKGTFVRTTRYKAQARIVRSNTPRFDGPYTYLETDYLVPAGWGIKCDVIRTITDTLPVPFPTFTPPFEEKADRLKNAIALVAAVFGRKFSSHI